MDPNDLLKLLDLDGEPPDSVETGVVAAAAVGDKPAPPARVLTALEVDAWGLRRGRDLVAESERLRAAGTDEFAAADFFAAAFDPDPVLDGVVRRPAAATSSCNNCWARRSTAACTPRPGWTTPPPRSPPPTSPSSSRHSNRRNKSSRN